MLTLIEQRAIVDDIRAHPFGVVEHSRNEREGIKRAEQLARGNFEILRAMDRHVEREIARETR